MILDPQSGLLRDLDISTDAFNDLNNNRLASVEAAKERWTRYR